MYGTVFTPSQGLTDDDLASRRTYVGGSDIAAVMGLSKWAGPRHVALQKRGLVPPMVPNDRMALGIAMEPAIVSAYAATKGRKVWRPGLRRLEGTTVIATRVDGLSGDLEAEVPDRCVEVKNVHYSQADYWGAEGSNIIPIDYLCQALWHCGIWGLPVCDVVACVGGEPRYFTVDADPETFGRMVDRAQEFWERYVDGDEEPPVDATASTTDDLKRIAWRDDAMLAATAEHDQLAMDLLALRDSLKTMETAKDLLENQLREAIGENSGIRGSTYAATWRPAKGRMVVDWQSIAEAYSPSADQVTKHTRATAGSRRLVLRRSK